MAIIKREKWKKGFFVTARDNKGKLLTYVKYNKKQPIKKLEDIFNKNGTFNSDITKIKGKNLTEYAQYVKGAYELRKEVEETTEEVIYEQRLHLTSVKVPKSFKKRKGKKVIQYIVEFSIGNTKIVARSQAYTEISSRKEIYGERNIDELARREAWENALGRLAQHLKISKRSAYEKAYDKLLLKVSGVREGKITYV